MTTSVYEIAAASKAMLDAALGQLVATVGGYDAESSEEWAMTDMNL